MAADTLSGFIANINAFLLTAPRATLRAATYKHAKALLLPHNIAVGDDSGCTVAGSTPTPFRLILTTINHKADFTNELARAANGLLLNVAPVVSDAVDTGIWTCTQISNPPPNFNDKMRPDTIREALAAGAYDVYTVADGTLVTLYHWQGRWRMATRRSCEIDAMVWRGYTYRAVFDDALARTGLAWTMFNPEHTYTVGFCHPAFHPFGQPADFTEAEQRAQPPHPWCVAIWHVQSTDPAAATLIPTQPIAEVTDYDTLVRANTSALEAWQADNTIRHFGYILRCKNTATTSRGYTDTLLQSTLFSAIHNTIYSLDARLPPTKLATLREYHRDLNFVLLFAYINSNTRGYLNLFPQFDARVKEIGRSIAMAARMICEPATRKESHPAYAIYARLAGMIGDQYLYGGKHCDRKTVVNLLCNVNYADVYYEEMFREKAAPLYKWAPRTLGDYVEAAAARAAAPDTAAAPAPPIIKMQKPNVPSPAISRVGKAARGKPSGKYVKK